MSQVYNLLWQTGIEELADILELENSPQEVDEAGKTPAQRDISWDEAHKHYMCLYIKYLQAFRKLEEAYDNIVHPQKRQDIRQTLDCTMARLLQIKAELGKFGSHGDQSTFLFFDKYLLDLRLTPYDMEVPVPRYFVEEVAKGDVEDERVQARDFLTKTLEDIERARMESQAPGSTPGLPMTKERAIAIIQKNERGRQGINHAARLKQRRKTDLTKSRADRGDAQPMDKDAAAVRIQKVWRTYSTRLFLARAGQKEREFIGMQLKAAHDDRGNPRHDPRVDEAAIRAERKQIQEDNEVRYHESLMKLEEELKEQEGPAIKNQMLEERFNWWREKRKLTGKFPENFDKFYIEKSRPPDWEAQEAVRLAEEAEAAALAAKSKGKAKAPAKDTKGKGKGKDEAADAKARERQTMKIGPSEQCDVLLECVAKYKNVWARLDESNNLAQAHDPNIAKQKLMPIVLKQLQDDVDAKLLTHLQHLKLQAEGGGKDKKDKKKSKKGVSKKGGSKKGEKGKKKSTKKKAAAASESDSKKKLKKCCEAEKLVFDAALIDLIGELVQAGVLRSPAKTGTNGKPLTVSSFLGAFNAIGSLYSRNSVVVDPNPQQIRQALTEHFVLPLGSPWVKQFTPLINSLLLFGPSGSGKTMLSEIAAAASGSLLFDLSPARLEERLPAGTDIGKLVHMVFEVADALQPAVIYIDEVDKLFPSSGKKAGKGAKSPAASAMLDDLDGAAGKGFAAKIKSALSAHKSLLDKTRRIVIVGNMREFEKVDKKELVKFFNADSRFFPIALPDHASRLLYWREFISQLGIPTNCVAGHNGVSHSGRPAEDPFRTVNLEALACISEGYTAGSIERAVKYALPPRRVSRIKRLQAEKHRYKLDIFSLFKVSANDLITALSKQPLMFLEDYRARAAFIAELQGDNERASMKEQAVLIEAGVIESKNGDPKKKGKSKKG